MRIGGWQSDERVLVVAEIGNNHEGDLARARALVRAVAEAGADAVKFQTYKTELFVRPEDAERFARLQGFELTQEQFAELAELAHELGLLFLSTPLDLESAVFLEQVADAIKIASGDNTFWPLLEQVARSEKPLIVSTGLVDEREAAQVLEFVGRFRSLEDVAVLHAVTAYPTEPEDVNLRVIPELAARLGVAVGYSDHTLGIEACVAAAALGARILEKHLTLDPVPSDFRDHELSARPDELAELVRRVREVETLLGEPAKRPRPAELEIREAVRRSIAACRDLPVGHVVVAEDISWLRPGGGLEPGREAEVVGRTLRRAIGAGEHLRLEDLTES